MCVCVCMALCMCKCVYVHVCENGRVTELTKFQCATLLCLYEGSLLFFFLRGEGGLLNLPSKQNQFDKFTLTTRSTSNMPTMPHTRPTISSSIPSPAACLSSRNRQCVHTPVDSHPVAVKWPSLFPDLIRKPVLSSKIALAVLPLSTVQGFPESLKPPHCADQSAQCR